MKPQSKQDDPLPFPISRDEYNDLIRETQHLKRELLKARNEIGTYHILIEGHCNFCKHEYARIPCGQSQRQKKEDPFDGFITYSCSSFVIHETLWKMAGNCNERP